MKGLKYLMGVIMLFSMLNLHAQYLAQQPTVEMRSTSSMPGSGSRLPQAALTGVTTTYTSAVVSSSSQRAGNARRATLEDDDWEDDEFSETDEPWKDPIGEGWVMLVLAAGAGGAIVLRRRKRKKVTNP